MKKTIMSYFNINNIASFVTSLLFLYLAFRNVDLKQIPQALNNLNYRYLFLIIISLCLENIFRAFRWRRIISQPNLNFMNVFKALVLGSFMNYLFPARLGDLFKAFYLGQKIKTSSVKLLASVVIERFADGVMIVLLILFSIFYYSLGSEFKHAGTLVTIFYLGVFLAILLIIKYPTHFEKLIIWVFSIFPKFLSMKAKSIANSLKEGFSIIADLQKFTVIISLSFIAWLNSTITYYLYFQLFQLSINFAGAILLISIISIGAMLPTVPGLIGIYQWCCMLVLHNILHEPSNLAATFSIVTHFINYAFTIVLGLCFIHKENLITYISIYQKQNSYLKNESKLNN